MNITREQSNTLRAIAIIMVLIGHGFSRLGESNLDILKWGGMWCSNIFNNIWIWNDGILQEKWFAV